MKHNQTMSKNAVRGIINHLSSHTVRHSKQNATQHKSCHITMLQLMQRAVAIFVMVMMCGGVWGQTNQTNANSRPNTFYTSIAEIGTAPFAIVNTNEGKALYGSTNQNIAYADYATAFVSSNAVTQYKLEAVTGGYLLRCVTPTGGDYGLWGSNPCYFNAQPNIGGVTFNLGLNNQNGQDMANGAVWKLNYVSGNGWTLQCVGNNGYAAPNGVTQAVPYYWQFCSLTYTLQTNAISNNNMIYAYKIQNQRDNNSYYFVANGSTLNSNLKTSNVDSDTNANTAYWYFIPNGNNGYSIMQLVSGYGVHYPDMDTSVSVDNANGNNSKRGQITLTENPSAFRFNNDGFILHGVANWDLEPNSNNGANLNLWLNTSLDNTLGRWKYVSEQGIPLQKVFRDVL